MPTKSSPAHSNRNADSSGLPGNAVHRCVDQPRSLGDFLSCPERFPGDQFLVDRDAGRSPLPRRPEGQRRYIRALARGDLQPVNLHVTRNIDVPQIQSVDCAGPDVSNLFICDARGGRVRRVGFDQVHTLWPTVLDDGRVVYMRWDYNDRSQIYPQGLFQMNADGSGQTEFYGNNTWEPTTLFHPRGIPGTGKVMGTHDVTERISPTIPRLRDLISTHRDRILGHLSPQRPSVGRELIELDVNLQHLQTGLRNGDLRYLSCIMRSAIGFSAGPVRPPTPRGPPSVGSPVSMSILSTGPKASAQAMASTPACSAATAHSTTLA